MPRVQPEEGRRLSKRDQWYAKNKARWEDVPIEQIRRLTPTKSCSTCKKRKDSRHFHRLNRTKDGLQPRCNPCMRAAKAKINRRLGKAEVRRRRALRYERTKRDPELWEKKREALLRHRLKKYGITLEEYRALHRRQKGRCRICEKKRKLYLDHDHSTGRIRELLCDTCNRGIGFLQDDPIVLLRAAKYVHAHKRGARP